MPFHSGMKEVEECFERVWSVLASLRGGHLLSQASEKVLHLQSYLCHPKSGQPALIHARLLFYGRSRPISSTNSSRVWVLGNSIAEKKNFEIQSSPRPALEMMIDGAKRAKYRPQIIAFYFQSNTARLLF